VVCLVLVGFWTAYAIAVSQSYGTFALLVKQMIWTVLGAALAAGLYCFDYRRLQRHGWWLMAEGAVASGFAGLYGPSTLYPFAAAGSPLLFVPGLAALFSRWDWHRRFSGWSAVALGAVPAMGYLLLNKARFVPLYLALWAVLLLLSRPPLRQLLHIAAGGLAGVGLLVQYVFMHPYRVERLRAWLMPWQDPQGAGYVVIQSRRTLTEAGLWGHGALSRETFLPHWYANDAFPFLVHTLGWVAGGALCLLILLFLLRAARAAAQSRNRYGTFLLAGFLTVFAVSFVWNIVMQAGWMPLTAVDLPFISAGRQQVVQLAAVGLMLSVFRRKDLGGNVSME
jgi:cell division protein FtsW (lipid II flippase)